MISNTIVSKLRDFSLEKKFFAAPETELWMAQKMGEAETSGLYAIVCLREY